MPIVNCIISPDCGQGRGDPVELWANESGISTEHMTVNVIRSEKQFGNKYTVMANLQLPTMWSSSDVSVIQKGLARALAKYYDLEIAQVHVVTQMVESGMVVEDGRELQW